MFGTFSCPPYVLHPPISWPKSVITSKSLVLNSFEWQLGELDFACRELLGGRFGNFYFFLVGEGEGAVRGARRGGGRFLLKVPGGGGFPGGDGVSRRVVWSELGNLGGGGGYIFFLRGRNVHQDYHPHQKNTGQKHCCRYHVMRCIAENYSQILLFHVILFWPKLVLQKEIT